MNQIFPVAGRAAAPADDPELSNLLAEIRSRAAECNAARQVPQDLVEKLRRIGVYRAMVARVFGGEERSPAEFCRLIEAISAADGSVGWVASFGAAAAYLAGLPEATLRRIYADGPDIIFAGAMFPPQAARKIPGGVRVTGRWPFGSGCTGADLIGVGITIAGDETGGLPRVAVMPAPQVRIDPNWDVIGLRGTGSHDLVVEDVEVSENWTFIRGAGATVDAPVYRYPALGLAAQVLAVVGLGVARGALDDVIALSARRASITGAPKMADRPYVQSAIAQHEAELRSARAFFYEATEAVWAEVLQAGKPAVETTALLRLASSHAARIGAEVTRGAFGLTGTAAIASGHRLAVALADATVVAQHAFLSEGTIQNAGRVVLGLPVPPGFP